MSLRQSAILGVKWESFSKATVIGIEFLRLAVLTRMLSPADFGLKTMIMVAIGFAQSFEDLGISNAVIYRQDVTHHHLSSIYWLNLIAGIALFIFVWAATPLLVLLFNEPRLAVLLPWEALVFIITPLGRQFQTLMQKELQFDRLAKVELASAIVSAVVAIFLARFGCGVFSLIWGEISLAASKAVLSAWLSWNIWRPELHFQRSDLQGYLSFGIYQMGERGMDYLSVNADYLVVGRFLGSKILGTYMLAYRLVALPIAKINPIVTSVAFPVFARKQSDNATLRRGYLEMIKLLALTVFPILIGLGIAAPLVVPLFFGAGWAAAIPLVQIMVLLGILKTMMNPSISILWAKGRTDIGFLWYASVALINVMVFWSVVQYQGAYGVAWSQVILYIAYFIFFGSVVLRFVIGLTWSEYLLAIAWPAIMSMIMGGIVLAAYVFLARLPIDKPCFLLGLTITGAIAYGPAVIMLERKFLLEIWSLIIKKKQVTA
ncbi:MAG: MOP flippase family protein [bacterium]